MVVLWLLSIVGVWIVASERHGNGIGCLWAVVLFILGPLAPIVAILYLLLGKAKEPE